MFLLKLSQDFLGTRDFLSRICRLAVGPIQFPVQWVQGTFSSMVKELGMKLTTHFHVVQRLKTSGGIPVLLPPAFVACT